MNKKNIIIILILAAISFSGYLQYKKNKSQESSIPPSPYDEAIVIKDPYAYTTPPNAKTAAAFMTLTNTTNENNKLIDVKSNIAEHTEIHENVINPDNGVMVMRKINGIKIPKEDSVELKPRGYHVMFINLNTTLKTGDSFPLTLIFENTIKQTIDVKVIPTGTIPSSHYKSNE